MSAWKLLEGPGVGILEREVRSPRVGGFAYGQMCSFEGSDIVNFI
jgi:hypothetical protein